MEDQAQNAERRRIISAAESLLETARHGLEDAQDRPGRQMSGIRNAVVFGRNATWALQNLRGKAAGFDEWYAVKQEEMRADPLMRFFHDVRTAIEKKASTPVGMVGTINFSSDSMGPPPPGATSFFIGDHEGRSGWTVQLPDGKTENYYVELPGCEFNRVFEGAPHEIGGEERSAFDMLEEYLTKVGAVVSEAREQFIRL